MCLEKCPGICDVKSGGRWGWRVRQGPDHTGLYLDFNCNVPGLASCYAHILLCAVCRLDLRAWDWQRDCLKGYCSSQGERWWRRGCGAGKSWTDSLLASPLLSPPSFPFPPVWLSEQLIPSLTESSAWTSAHELPPVTDPWKLSANFLPLARQLGLPHPPRFGLGNTSLGPSIL